MIEQLPVAVFMKSVKDGKYIFWNKASEEIFDLHASDVIGRTDPRVFFLKERSLLMIRRIVRHVSTRFR